MAPFARAPEPPEHQLYNILDDGDVSKQLTRPTSECETLERSPSFYPPAGNSSSGVIGSHQLDGTLDDEDDEDVSKELARPASECETLGRYPLFHPPAGSYSSGVVGSYSTGEPSSSSNLAAGQLHLEYSCSEGSLGIQLSEPAHKNTTTSPMYTYESPALPQGQPLTSTVIEELHQLFAKAKGLSNCSSMETFSVVFTTACPSSHPSSVAPSPTSNRLRLSFEDDFPIASLGPRRRRFTFGPDSDSEESFAIDELFVPNLPYWNRGGHSPSPPWSSIPFPAGSRYSSRTGGSRKRRRLSGASLSSGSEDASSSFSVQPRYKRSKFTQWTTNSAEHSVPAEWIYPLPLVLEELFRGGTYTFRISIRLLSGELKIQEVQIDIRPGWKRGTKIIFPDAGNERAPGVFQTMIFVVEQVHHERFARLDGGRLVYNEDIDLVDALKENRKREPRKLVGLDGGAIKFYPPSGVINDGQETVIKGEGMHLRSKDKVVGRGDLIIRWNIKRPTPVLASIVDPEAASSSPIALKSTLSTSTSNICIGSMSTLGDHHTGGSLTTSEYTQAASTSTPLSFIKGIRATSTMSVLQPSDFAQREAALQKTNDAPTTFHTELERRDSKSSSSLDLEDLPQDGDVPQDTYVLPFQSVLSHTLSSSPLLAPQLETTNGSLNASPEGSPAATTLDLPTPPPELELQVLELNKQLMDTTLENKTPKAETSNTVETVMDLQSAHREKTPAATEPPSPTECSVPKAEFDASLKDTEKATAELEKNEKKSEERQKGSENLAAQAAKLQSKTEALENPDVDPHNAAAKETPEEEIHEAAVEQLLEQVESSRRQSGEVSRRNSSSSKFSERYGPSSTQVPLAWNCSPNATDTASSPTPTMEQTPLDVASHDVNRLSQIISVAPAESLPESEDLQRSIKSYRSESVRSLTILSTPLPIINDSDYDWASTEELSQSMNKIIEGFANESFDTGVLLLTAPAALTKPKATESKAPAPRVSTLMSPTKASRLAETHSVRSEDTVSSLKDPSRQGKKKGWLSRFMLP